MERGGERRGGGGVRRGFGNGGGDVCWLLNVSAACTVCLGSEKEGRGEGGGGGGEEDLLGLFAVLHHCNRSCRSNFLSNSVKVY